MMALPGRMRPRTRGGQFGGWLPAAQPGSTQFLVLTRRTDPRTGGSEMGAWLAVAAALAVSVVVLAAARLPGAKFGQLLLLGAVALVLGIMVLRSAPLASIILIIAMAMYPATPHVLPIDAFWVVFAGVVGALVLWMDQNPDRPRGMDSIEWATALFLAWNVYSMISPHEYGALLANADHPAIVVPMEIWRMLAVSILLPLVLYRVGRYAFDRVAVVQALLSTIMILAAYSAAMSIMQFTGPTALVWPRYIVDDQKDWPGRAAGVFKQPDVNGWLLALGVAVAMLLMSRRSEPTWRRWSAFVVAIACGYGIYLTHTRTAWIAGVVVLIIGALIARGYRKGFLVAICLVASAVAFNWSVFTSSDRRAGGVGSMDEVHDRLNADQTALWAFDRKPLFGWGIGRFQQLNTYHHQQWAPDIPWVRGYAAIAHSNELAILAEVGVIGLALWFVLLVLVLRRLWSAYRTLPDHDLCGKPVAVVAIMATVTVVCTGMTVDLRLIEFPMLPVFLLAGITVGWADRHKRLPSEAVDDIIEPALVRHG